MSTCERCGKDGLLGFEMVNVCKECASSSGAQPPQATNQLKAEIAAKIEHAIRHFEDKDLEAGVFELMQLKRKLSAI